MASKKPASRSSERVWALASLLDEMRMRLMSEFPELLEGDEVSGARLLDVLAGNGASHVQVPSECYKLEWYGRKQAEIDSQKTSECRLEACIKLSKSWKTTKNIYIRGDNLDALKILRAQYENKIKMIYIDPPYNSGAERIYNDCYHESVSAYIHQTGQSYLQGGELSACEIEGCRHNRWLSMMYARLRVARDLLCEDGAIFISIDDHEQANLRRLCDEIFGSDNYICCFVWNTKQAGQGMATAHRVVSNHEYIYVYAKCSARFAFKGVSRDPKNGFSNPDDDPRGPWKRQYLQRFGQGLPERTVTDPKTGISYTFETPYSQEKLDLWIKEGRILFPRSKYKYPVRKEFLNEYEHPQQLTTELGLFSTKSATEKLYQLFGGTKIFANPKPLELIKFLIAQASSADGEDIILDFFSGSATTAHAVMQLNAEDGGNRRFVMIQIPEACNAKSEACRAGYKDIFEIGRKRIILAGDAILKEHPDLKDRLDVGFRVYEVKNI